MTALSGLASYPFNNPLITSAPEHLRLIAEKVSEESIPIYDVAYLVAQYAHETSLTKWHTALSRLEMLPEQIPPLNLDITQIRDGICPIGGSFYLLPPGTLSQFVAKVSAYGQKHLAAFGGENPLQLSFFVNPTCQEQGNTQLEKYEWRWMSDGILEGSRDGTYQQQEQIVAALGPLFKIPSLRDAAKCLFLHTVATDESLLQEGNEQNGNLSTYTRVRGTCDKLCLVLGGSSRLGVKVESGRFDNKCIGVVALRKF